MVTDNEIISQVRQAFKEAFGTPEEVVSVGATPSDIAGWDSLGHAKLTACLEKVFNITFDIDELMAMEDVATIVDIMRNKLK
jgi:acyl carrier protein